MYLFSMQKKKQKKREQISQIKLIDWRNSEVKNHPELEWLFSVPNGLPLHPKVAYEATLEGLTAGVSDLLLLCPRAHWHGLCLEMKDTVGVIGPDQKRFLNHHSRQGYCTRVCYSFESARDLIINYLMGMEIAPNVLY